MNIENQVVLGLGGNMGNRTQYLAFAMVQIIQQIGPITKVSSVYETAAWGNTDQPPFLNQVIVVITPFTPLQTLQKCLQIEKSMGRRREIKWGPRLIDIDILLYNDAQIQRNNLQIPHPFLHQRRFVLQPLADVLPRYNHPTLHKTLQQLLTECPDTLPVTPFHP